jgi:xylulokinase
MKLILAIDMGTSGPKVALVSTDGFVVGFEFEPIELVLLPEGGAEQDPDNWWAAISRATQRVIAKSKISKDDIIAVCCTTQWSGTVPVDQDGNHLMNAIIWMDSRGAKHLKEISGRGLKLEGYGAWRLYRWIRITGGIFGQAGKDPLAHILYIKNELPEVYEKTYKFLEPKDYLNLRLTGMFAASHDSICLHWLTDNRDISNVHYHHGLIKMSGIEFGKLPDLKRAVDILGPVKSEVAEELGLPKQIPVIMGTPDIQSAALGSGAVRDGQGHIYIGTSSWLVCHLPFKKTDIFHDMACLPSAIPDRYLLTNEQESAGACLNYLIDNLLFCKDELSTNKPPAEIYEKIEQVARQAPAGSGGVIFTPWLNGERSPVENRFVRGGFHNLSLETSRKHLVRAVLEGVAYNSRWLLGYVEKLSKIRMSAISMIGGGANSKLWCQIYADVLGRKINQIKDPIQANAKGAGFLAAVALGELTFEDIPDRVEIANEFSPCLANKKIYDRLFAEYIKLYKANKSIYQRLNRE